MLHFLYGKCIMVKKYTIAIIAMLLCNFLFAQENVTEKYIYVPYQNWQQVWQGKNKKIKLSDKEYQELLAKQKYDEESAPQNIVVKSAAYKGEIKEGVLTFNVILEIESFSDHLSFCDFEFGQYGVSNVKLDGEDTPLFVQKIIVEHDFANNNNNEVQQQYYQQNDFSFTTVEKNQYRLLIRNKGTHTFTMACHKNMDIKRDVLSAEIVLGNFSQQSFSLLVGNQYICETQPAHMAKNDEIVIYPEPNTDIHLSLRPREKQDEKKAIELTEIHSSHLVKQDTLKSHFVIDVNVQHQPLKTFQFVIPEKIDLLNISENRWDVVTENNQRILVIQLEKELIGQHTINIKAETQLLEDGDFNIPKITSKGDEVFRQDGIIYVEKTDDVKLELLSTKETRQLDFYSAESNYSNSSKNKYKRSSGKLYSFGHTPFATLKIWNDEYNVAINKTKIQNAMESDVATGLSIYPDGLELVAHVNFTVTEGEIKQLSMKLPEKWMLSKVDTFIAKNVQQSLRNVATGSYYIKEGMLVIPLEEKLVKGNLFKVSLVLQKFENDWLSKWKGTRYLELPVVMPQNAKYLPSFIGVMSHQDYAIVARDLKELSTVDLNIIRSLNIISKNLTQGYKLHSAESKGTLEITQKEPQVSVVAAHYIEVEAERIKYATTLVYNIKNASVDSFRFATPIEFNSILNIVDDKGIIKEKRESVEDDRKIWHIDLQKKVMGNYSLYLTHEAPIVTTNDTYKYTPLFFYDVEYIKGFVGIQKSSRLDVEKTVKNLEEIAPVDVPIFAHPDFTPSNDFSYAAKYTKDNYDLSLRVGVHDKADVASAILEDVTINTLFPGNGSERVECNYTLKHLGKQFFTVTLPENANFWSAIVNDEGELPLRRENDITIPIPPSNNGESIHVRIMYERPAPDLQDWGKVKLERPETEADIPVRSLNWNVYLPKEYDFAQEFRNVRNWDVPWYVHVKWVSVNIWDDLFGVRYKSNSGTYDYRNEPQTSTEYYPYPEEQEVVNQPVNENTRGRRQKRKEEEKKVTDTKNTQNVYKTSPKKPQVYEPEAPQSKYDGYNYDADELVDGDYEDDWGYNESPSDSFGDDNAPGKGGSFGQSYGGKDSLESNLDLVLKEEYQSADKSMDSQVWETGEQNIDEIGNVISDKEFAKMNKQSSIETVKAKGLRSMNLSFETSGSQKGHHSSPPQTRSIEISYAKDNIIMSLFFLIVVASTFLGFIVVSQQKIPRLPILLSLLLAASFAPLWWGTWLNMFCNFVVLGLSISCLLFFVSKSWSFIVKIFQHMGSWFGIGKTVALLIVTCVLLNSNSVYAEDETREIYVPYDPKNVTEIQRNEVFLTYDDYMKLWNGAYPEQRVEEQKELPSFVLYNALYEGKIENNQVVFDAQIRTEVFKVPAVLNIGLASTSITKASIRSSTEDRQIGIDANKDGYQVVVQEPGVYTLYISFIPSYNIAEKRGSFSFLPAAIPASKISFLLDKDMEADLEKFVGGWVVNTTDSHKVLSLFPSMESSGVDVSWYESSERYRAKGLNLSVESSHELTTFDNTLRLSSQMQYTIASGECQHLQLTIPQGWEVIQLSCNHLEKWSLIKEDSHNLVKIQLIENRDRNLNLKMQLEKSWNTNSENYIFPEIEALGVNRENGHVTLTYQDPYKITINDQSNVRKIRSFSNGDKFSDVFRYNQHPFDLKFTIEEQKYKNFVNSSIVVAIAKDKVETEYTTVIEVKAQQMFKHSVLVPKTWEVISVEERSSYKGNIADWRLKNFDDDYKLLEIVFYRSVSKDKNIPLYVKLEKDYKIGDELQIPRFIAQNVEYESGVILIASSGDLDLRSEQIKGIQSYSTSECKLNKSDMQKRLAFRYEGIDYSGNIVTELKKPEVSVQVVINSLVEDDWLNFGYFLKYQINHAGVDTFHFRLPKELGKYVDILGENIREKRSVETEKFTSWTVVLHNKVQGSYDISLFPDIIKNNGTGIHFHPILFPPEIEKQISIVIQNQSQYEITEQKTNGLTAVSAKQIAFLPPATKANDFIRSYKVTQNDWELVFSENIQKIQHSVHAEIDTIKVDTILQKSGECYHRIIFNLRHSGLQFLELEKIEGIKVWGVFVANRFVRPSQKNENGKEIILIPLYKTTHKEQKIAVRLIYEQNVEEVKNGKEYRFEPLKVLNIEQINSVSWTLYAPQDFLYKYDGNVSLSKAQYDDFVEYSTNINDINTYSISRGDNESNLKDAISHSNSLKNRQSAWMEQVEENQKQLFANVQDMRQQQSFEQNRMNLEKIQQYGMDNLVDAQRVRRGSKKEVYNDLRADYLAGESEESFIERQSTLTQQQLSNKQAQIRQQLDTSFYFDIEIPSNMEISYFAKKQGNPALIVKSYEKPQDSKFWIAVQFIGLFLVVLFGSIFKVFSFKKYSFQRFILTILLIGIAIFLCNFTQHIHNFYF